MNYFYTGFEQILHPLKTRFLVGQRDERGRIKQE